MCTAGEMVYVTLIVQLLLNQFQNVIGNSIQWDNNSQFEFLEVYWKRET